MKNLTKQNFKTNPLWIRLLIMAFMLLAGSSSAWASTVYFINSLSWTDIKIYYWGNISVDWDKSPSMTKENYQINGSDVYKFTFDTDPQNIIFRGNGVQTVDIAFSAGKQWTPNNQWDNGKAKGSWSTYTPPCTKSVSDGSGRYSNGEISLSAKFNTCGDAYIGFQWKKQDDIDWCYTNDGTEKCYKALGEKNKSNAVEETSFTKINNESLSGTYVFRPYIVDGSDATKWIYGNEFEVITCSDPSAGYSISNENASVDWDGTEKEVIITTASGYATPSDIYYEGNETKPTAVGEYTITIDVPSKGTYCAATNLEIGTFTITCPTIAAPAITTTATVCAGTPVTLSNYNGVNDNTVKWYSDEECNSEVTEQVTLTDNDTKYYAKAYHEASGCYSSQYSTLTFKVNPLPNITISGSEKAVLYEDVTLTATATDGAIVKWYEGVEEKATGATYVVTSETATSKTVTAKAFLNGCESAVANHTVAFSAETCNNVADMTKIYFDATDNPSFVTGSYVYVTITGKKDNNNSNGSTSCSGNGVDTSGGNKGNYVPKNDSWWGQMKKVAGESYIFEITIHNDVTKGTTKLSFWNNKIDNYSDVYNVQAILGQKTSSETNCMKLYSNKTHNNDRSSDFYCGTWIKYENQPEITAPAVKTVSVETEPGEGNIIFEGQVVKTGCAETLTYGFAYSTDANADKSTWTKVQCTNVGNTVGTPFRGSKTELEDGTYYVCAYITNSFGTSFGEAKEKELTTSTDPVKTAEIKLVNVEEAGHKYCVGATAYIEVTSDVKYTTATWKSDLGVEVEQIGKTNIYQFEVKGKDQIVVLLSNKHNTEPVSSEPLEVDVYASPSVPEIALGASSICDTNEDGTTLTVTRTKAGQYYALYKEDGNGGTLVEDYQLCSTDDAEIEFTGLKEAAKYFVKTYTSECRSAISVTSSTTLTVVDSKNVKISIEPTSTETTPWMPVKLTVTATSDYTVTSDPNDAVINISGNIVKVKLPLPTEGVSNKGTTENDVNVTFTDVPYTITAELKTAGEEANPCAKPAEADILLIPYTEVCP